MTSTQTTENTPANPPEAPVAKKVPVERTHHGDTFVDDYEWLREKDNPEVRAHLNAENAYTEALTADQQPLRDTIFGEIKKRTLETDLSVPSRRNGWWYYSRTVEGGQHPVSCRVRATGDGSNIEDWTPPQIDAQNPPEGEQILLDGNKEAEGKPFFSLGTLTISEDGNLLAWGVDNAGDERFTLRFRNLETDETLDDVIEGAFYDAQFHPDGKSIFYSVVDESWRPHEIRQHVLGTPVSHDVVIARENDQQMWLGAEVSDNQRYLVVGAGNSEYSEVRVLDLAEPGSGLRTVIDRSERVLYDVTPVTIDGEDRFVLVHNRNAVNSAVDLIGVDALDQPLAQQQWTPVLEHRDTVRINGVGTNRTHLFVSVRQDTIERVQVLELAGLGTDAQSAPQEPAFDEELYTASLVSAEYDAPVARLSYASFVTPPRVYDWFPGEQAAGDSNSALHLRRETPVLGGYDPADYVAERAWATADDGARIPLSIIRRADLSAPGEDGHRPHPVIQYGYGSYEISMDPAFSIARLSLLDRGAVFVIAHIRGGGELGRAWYENGKKLSKRNSFTDFVAATDWLVETGWADSERIVAMGGSAGGLLMGAVANLAPEKYRAVVAVVPFVDALTSILDPDLPLSALEWEEWGNPIEDAQVYEYMRGYTPYENIEAVHYPKIAAVTSLNDTRVLYVEPAKWVARLREISTGSEPILLKTEMDGGHGGASGRYEKWKDTAWQYAFILDALDLAD